MCYLSWETRRKNQQWVNQKIINQLQPEEISTALSERKAGNITGAGSPAKQRLSEQDIHNLSEYIQTLK